MLVNLCIAANDLKISKENFVLKRCIHNGLSTQADVFFMRDKLPNDQSTLEKSLLNNILSSELFLSLRSF